MEPRREQVAAAREAADVAPPAWVTGSPLLASAYSLAESAHRHQRRPTDGRLFLDHVTEVATFLHEAAFDEKLVAVGLLHDSVERGSLSADELRGEMGEEIASFVMALTEDATIDSFEMRKAALRDQVRAGGELAVTVFAADKLSDIIGLRRGIGQSGQAIEERMGTTIAGIAGHYTESVELIGSVTPRSTFLPALREQLDRLAAESCGPWARPPEGGPTGDHVCGDTSGARGRVGAAPRRADPGPGGPRPGRRSRGSGWTREDEPAQGTC